MTKLLKETEKIRLKKWVDKVLGSESDKFDLDAHIDSTLNYIENKEQIRSKINSIAHKSLIDSVAEARSEQEKFRVEEIHKAESEVEEYNKKISNELTENLDVDKYFKNVTKAIDKLCAGFSNLVFVRGRGGLGKSRSIKNALILNKAKYVEITGDVTEAYLYRLLYENKFKIIWFRDTSKLLKGIGALNHLKAATETEEKRILTKSSYSKQQADLPNDFIFEGKIIFDFNSLAGVGKSLKGDFEALISRGTYIHLSFSKQDIIKIMEGICQTDNQREVTKKLIELHKYNGDNMLNLRTQWHAFNTYEYAKKENLDWNKLLEEEVKNTESEVRRQIYTLIGKRMIKTKELKKLMLLSKMVSSLRVADRKIKEWLITEEIFKVSPEERNFNVCLIPLKREVIQYAQ